MFIRHGWHGELIIICRYERSSKKFNGVKKFDGEFPKYLKWNL